MTTISKFKNFKTDLMLEDYMKVFENEEEPSSWKNTKDRVVSDLGLNFLFLTTFATSIQAFFPVVESLMMNMNLSNVEINRETVVMLSICALAIVFNEEKSTYKKMFEELRLRGVYNSLKKLVGEMDFLKKIFQFFAKNTGRVVVTFSDMFGYTALLVPFLHTLHMIATTKGMSVETLPDLMNSPLGWGDLLSLTVGVGTFTVKNLIIELIDKIKKYTFNIPFLKKTVDKLTLSNDELDEIGNDLEIDDDIKKYTEYTNQDLIQDDLNESAGHFNLYGAMEKIRNKYTMSEVTAMVDEEIFSGNWIDKGWEDDFDDEYDAYLGTGGRKAENAIVQQIKSWFESNNTELKSDESVALIKAIEDEYGLDR